MFVYSFPRNEYRAQQRVDPVGDPGRITGVRIPSLLHKNGPFRIGDVVKGQ